MRIGFRHVTLLSIALVAHLIRCSSPSEPVVDGGTHTGNPDITAAASIVFQMASLDTAWHIDAYLPPEYLNPENAVPGNPGLVPNTVGGLAKKTADSTRIYVWVDTIVLVDTMYQYDTLLAIDTILDTSYIVSDTLDTLIGSDSVIYISDSLAHETVLAVDTVVLTDTIFRVDTLFVTDTLMVNESKSTPYVPGRSPSLIISDGDLAYGNEPRYDSAGFELGDTTFRYYFPGYARSDYLSSPADELVRKSTRGTYALRKSYDSGDLAVSLHYYDKDGDGLLYPKQEGENAVIGLAEHRSRGVFRQVLRGAFDQGEDGRPATYEDNRLDYMNRVLVTNGDTVEVVEYNPDEKTDTLYLTVREFEPSDTVFDRRTRFAVLPGIARRLSHDDRLSAITQTVKFRFSRHSERPVKRIDARLTPMNSPNAVEGITKAEFSAVIHYFSGPTALFVGTFSPEEGIKGVFSKGEKETEVIIPSRTQLSGYGQVHRAEFFAGSRN